MNLTDRQKLKIVTQYKQWSDQLFDDLDWVTSIPPEVFVNKIIELIEKETQSNDDDFEPIIRFFRD